MAGFSFTEGGARRIVNAVRKVEGALKNEVGGRHKWPVGDDGGGGATLVLFELVTVDCYEGTGTGTPLKTGCNDSLPVGTQDIIDDLGCFLTGNEALLIGQYCWAVYTSGGPYGCAYSIISMCCLESEC